jgi:hypothetical protein
MSRHNKIVFCTVGLKAKTNHRDNRNVAGWQIAEVAIIEKHIHRHLSMCMPTLWQYCLENFLRYSLTIGRTQVKKMIPFNSILRDRKRRHE